MVIFQFLSTFKIRAPVLLPLYGPTGGITWVHLVESFPPIPPSATYRLPSESNVNPRGLLSPVAKTETDATMSSCLQSQNLPMSLRHDARASITKRTYPESKILLCTIYASF